MSAEIIFKPTRMADRPHTNRRPGRSRVATDQNF